MDIHEVSEFCDTSIEYIKKHYYHPDLLSPEILDKLDKCHDRSVKKRSKLFGFAIDESIRELSHY